MKKVNCSGVSVLIPALACFGVAVLLLVGVVLVLVFMRRKKQQRVAKNLEKTDVNLIYGEYYYTDGRSMATEMEVVSQIIQNMLRALEIKSEVKNCEFDSPDFYN